MEKINAIIIIEMIGKPADYLKETLSKFIERMQLEKGIKIKGKKINEPKKVDDSDLLSSFAEIELELESLQHLINLIFTYMPSHIEIISPENLRMTNSDMNSLCNDLTRRLLDYDSIAKKMIYERRILENQLREKGEVSAIAENSGNKKPGKARKKKTKKKKRK